jgi:hypothetical protein
MPGGYIVRDASGQALAYLYSRENPDEAQCDTSLDFDACDQIL